MKSVLIFLIITLSVLGGWLLYEKSIGPRPESALPPKPEYKISQDASILEAVNAKNGAIKSFSCSNIEVKLWMDGSRHRLTGSMFYEKDNRFRFVLSSVVGKEVEMGSNDTHFWFWSRRMEPSGLYYAKHEDFNRTRLRTPFNPKWMKSSLGFDLLNSKGQLVNDQDRYILVENLENAIGQPVTKMTYIDKKTQKVDGYLVLDKNNKKLVSGEVLSRSGELPQQILYVWFEENTSMLLNLSNPTINAQISPDNWKMPNINPKIDMSKDY